jgi:fibronectin type III domain protein
VWGPAGWGPPAPPPPPKRKRRVWPLVLTGVLVFGLVAGLLIWAPWDTPPPGAPAAVVATSRTATSAVVSWAASKGGATPDHYLVLRDGAQVGSVAAGQTSFTDNGLAPGTTHQYTIIAAAGQQRSSDSVEARVTTITPSPVALAGVKVTWTTATFRWSPSPLGPVPSAYEIESAGSTVATVPGTTTSYDLKDLAPGHSYQYQVVADWGSSASAPSAAVTIATVAPALNGDVPVALDTVSTPGGGASLSVGDHWTDSWTFAPHCAAASCPMTADADLAAPGFAISGFTVGLRDSGGKYTGTTTAQVSKCSTVNDTNTITLTIAHKGSVNNGAWTAWTGTMTVSAPYTAVGDEFCPAQSWTFAVSGTHG